MQQTGTIHTEFIASVALAALTAKSVIGQPNTHTAAINRISNPQKEFTRLILDVVPQMSWMGPRSRCMGGKHVGILL